MSLKETITNDMKAAMKAGDSQKLGTIRMLLAAMKQREVDEQGLGQRHGGAAVDGLGQRQVADESGVPFSTLPAGVGDSIFIDMKGGELARADFIEGSCSPEVLEQVKARRAQGGVNLPEPDRLLPPQTPGSSGVPAPAGGVLR